MKVIAVVEVDFERSPIGTRSRLADPLPRNGAAGEVVLRRTVRRLLACKHVARVHVAVHVSQRATAGAVLDGLDVGIETHEAPPAPWSAPGGTGGRAAAARKWSLDGWRGGIGGCSVFDESFNPWLLEALATRDGAEAVLSIPAAAVLADSALIDAMIDHFERIHGELRLTFAPAPPGLLGAVFMTQMLADLCKAGWVPGRLLAYRPDDPQRDLVIRDCCFRPGATIEQASGRLLADTDRSVARIEAVLTALGDEPPAAAIAQWLQTNDAFDVPILPHEVELELTTDDPLATTTLRPRGQRVGRRGPLDEIQARRLFEELASVDDSLLVFGGFGEPLAHPAFGELVRTARSAGVYGIAVRTNALLLDERCIRALIEANVDAVSILLDAHSATVYRQVHGADRFDDAVRNTRALIDAIHEHPHARTHVVPEFAKTRANLAEMEAFYDDWIRKTGSAVITAPAEHGGLLPAQAVTDMAPPRRVPCGRLWTRCVVLADGSVTVCDQDARGQHAIGRLQDASLQSLWTGAFLQKLRDDHRAGTCSAMPLCETCREWHRP